VLLLQIEMQVLQSIDYRDNQEKPYDYLHGGSLPEECMYMDLVDENYMLAVECGVSVVGGRNRDQFGRLG
jgi:hypothetical protein